MSGQEAQWEMLLLASKKCDISKQYDIGMGNPTKVFKQGRLLCFVGS